MKWQRILSKPLLLILGGANIANALFLVYLYSIMMSNVDNGVFLYESVHTILYAEFTCLCIILVADLVVACFFLRDFFRWRPELT
jgi:hypothetical protein